MTPRLSSGLRLGAACLMAAAWQFGAYPAAWAQQPPPLLVPAPAPEAPASTAVPVPAMAGPLVANPNPMKFDVGPNPVYLTGFVTGLGMFQSAPLLGDHGGNTDLTNGQFMLQTTEGLVQFYLQVGAYSLPALGTPWSHVDKTMGDLFGPIPQGYVKIAPNDAFSVLVGKLPTLIGAESTFTVQNMNIERGLLWNQENAVNRGVQANYTMGPLALSVSLNDGFYSDSYNWLSGLAAWTINKENTLTFVGMGNFDHTDKNVVSCQLANCLIKTSVFNNNGSTVDDHSLLPVHQCPGQCLFRSEGSVDLRWSVLRQLLVQRQLERGRALGVHRFQRKCGEWQCQPDLRARQRGILVYLDPDLPIGHRLLARRGIGRQGVRHHAGFRVRP